MQLTLCYECALSAATRGHVCTACYVRAMEEAHRALYQPTESEVSA